MLCVCVCVYEGYGCVNSVWIWCVNINKSSSEFCRPWWPIILMSPAPCNIYYY